MPNNADHMSNTPLPQFIHALQDLTDPGTAPTLAQVSAAVFLVFDADGNGLVTEAEFTAQFKDHNGHGGGPDATAIFATLDFSGTGSISEADVAAALTIADTDGDGLLHPSELAHGIITLVGVAQGHADVQGA